MSDHTQAIFWLNMKVTDLRETIEELTKRVKVLEDALLDKEAKKSNNVYDFVSKRTIE